MTTDLTQARTHAAGHRVGRGPEREVIARTIEGLADEVEEARESVSILNDVLLVLRNEQAYVSGSAVEMVRGLIAEVGRLRAQVAQAGWTLVPVEPTPEMLSAGYEGAANYSGQNEELGCWRAMLAASPAAQQAPQPLGDAATRPGLSAAGELTPIETIRYWADAYADPDSGDHFLGHGMIVHLLREYLAVRLAQAPEQAQEAAPASAHRPSVEWYRAKIADTEELDGSLPCGALAAPAQQAEPPSQAQAAERESIANELLLIASVLQGYPASMARGDALRAVTAVQLAVARICNASQAQAGDAKS